MRTVILEEHVSLPEMISQIPEKNLGSRSNPGIARVLPLLADITGQRLDSMDRCGITMQVLSADVTGANLVPPEQAPSFASRYNDLIAERISGHRDRFSAFAHLAMTAPAAAADELDRAVRVLGFKGAMINGTIEGQFLDHPRFAPLLERAEKLGVPIYIHPSFPPPAVADAYYSNIGGRPGMLMSLACFGWGWHSETAIHVLRMFLAGVFDRHPRLRIVIGHMGEMLPMMLVRSDGAFQPGNGGANQRGLIDTFREQVYITTSGLFTQPPLRVALDTFGVNRVMFSVDYPFSTMEKGVEFLRQIDLSVEDVEKVAHGNADALLGLD